MKGRYNGSHMSVYGSVIPGGKSLATIPVGLSKTARQRLKWFDYYNSHGYNARLTCRYFGISPQTFYRWKGRYNPHNGGTLEERSRRPRRVRQPMASPKLIKAVLMLRERYPRWGKDKLVIRLGGRAVSTSRVGRILRRLKEGDVAGAF